MTISPRAAIYDTLLLTYDLVVSTGVDIPEPWKRRDPKEPGRRVKTEFEDKLFSIMMRYFRRTKKKVRVFFEQQFPDRKALEQLVDFGALFEDPRLLAELLLWLTAAADSGIALFELEIGFGVSAAANTAAAEWARVHASELIGFLTDTQRNTIQRSVSTFIETPGMTIGDVVNDLIGDKLFTEDRAMRIAVSEVTNAFSEADRIAGEQLQADFPDVTVTKTWWTNADGLVCFICAPLHTIEIPLNEKWPNAAGGELDGPPGHVANCRCWRSTRTRI